MKIIVTVDKDAYPGDPIGDQLLSLIRQKIEEEGESMTLKIGNNYEIQLDSSDYMVLRVDDMKEIQKYIEQHIDDECLERKLDEFLQRKDVKAILEKRMGSPEQ